MNFVVMCDNNFDIIGFDMRQAMIKADKEYYASRERFKLKRIELANKGVHNPPNKTSSVISRRGALPDKQILFTQQNGLCALCKSPLKSALNSTIDHIIPRSKGGTNEISNKQLTHSLCNLAKGDSMEYISPPRYLGLVTELRAKMKYKKERKLSLNSSLKSE